MARWLVVTSAFDGVCLSMSNRSHLRSLALCLLALACCGGRGYVATSGPQEQVLPLEVFGVSGTERSIKLTLTPEQLTRAKGLQLRVHALGYEGKASIRIGTSDWIPLNNDRVSLDGLSRAAGGIGGPLSTLDLSLPIPAAAISASASELTFRLDRMDGISIGFRVLAINVLDELGAKLLAPSAFKQDEPSMWTAPTGSDATAGATLWAAAQLREGPGLTTELRARCSDCHAEDGRDLKYFNYSNFAIIERAKFYGLTEQQGKDIAAYIRSLNVAAPGRPWNPPFQPGPGSTDRPLDSFSAGAGIDALVDEDTTIAAIFKAGFDRTTLAVGNDLRRIYVSDIPIALQLLDWNHWLPEIHPKDSVGDSFETSAAKTMFDALRVKLRAMQGTALKQYWSNTGFDVFLGANAGAQSDFQGLSNAMFQLRTMVPGFPVGNAAAHVWTEKLAKQVYSIGVWSQVKTWELMNAFGLEGYAIDAYGLVGEKRAWFSRRHLADTSPFFQGNQTGSTLRNTEVNYEYINHHWQHLQLALNAGQRACGGHACIDYFSAAAFGNNISRLYEGGRRLLWGIKAMEEHDTGKGPVLYEGFSLATANPFIFLRLDETQARAWWKNAAHPDRARALSTTAQVFAEKLGTWTAESWRQENYGKGEDGSNFMDDTRVVNELGSEISQRSIPDRLWHTLPTLSETGVHPAVVNALARFGLAIWPRNDWMSQGTPLMGSVPAAPTVSASDASVKVQWEAGATSHNVYRATNVDGPWMAVALKRDGTSITDAPVQKGIAYYYAVSANTVNSESPLSPAVVSMPSR